MMEWLTAKEAAARLKVKPRTLIGWTREGRIPAHPLPGTEQRKVWRFLAHELDSGLLSAPLMNLLRCGAMCCLGRVLQ